MASDNVVSLHDAARKRQQQQRAQDRALWRSGLKHKLLCRWDRFCADAKEARFHGTQALILAFRFIFRTGCLIGSAALSFMAIREIFNGFPNGLAGYAWIVGSLAILLGAWRGIDWLLRRARPGSVFDVLNRQGGSA